VEGVGNGSGVVYRSDGYVVTNNHVVAPAERVRVRFADGADEEAEVVGTDRESDLAVLRVDRTDLQPVRVGDSESLSVGELAVAVGSPFGLGGSVTSGIVSAVDRGPISVRAPDGGAVSLVGVVQTDAAINPGNSGGPLLNGDAELIGINSAILTDATGTNAGNAGVGFAIPASLVVQVADELIASGEVRYAFLGVSGLPLSPELSARTGAEAGAYVEQVEPGTPAAEADIRSGDVIVALDGRPIDSMAALQEAIRAAEVGEEVAVTYRRGSSDTTVEVTLGEREEGDRP
jgi:S1-C subfamily serine protease